MKKRFPTIVISDTDSKLLSFFYTNFLGRMLLKPLLLPFVSKVVGAYMDTTISKSMIKGFIKKNQLDMSEYIEATYHNFNQFFMREIKPEARPFSDNRQEVAAPCDGKVTVYPIDGSNLFKIKQSMFNVTEMLGTTEDKNDWLGGYAVIFRLTPDDYHHFSFIDEGQIVEYQKIPGVFHTVRPVAIHHAPVFTKNTREVTIIETKNYGKVAQIEVGALLVGKIKNLKTTSNTQRLEKKGWFEFGGSTVVLLFQKNQIELDSEIIENTQNGLETIVKWGQTFAKKIEK